jgi:predicted transport protein
VKRLGDLKLFRLNGDTIDELEGQSVSVEKSLQIILERHLEAFLGVRFLASEYSTGKRHAGRIDTLGIDENNSPVIIEYKRSVNENVINQGLFYLDWLLDHKAEFELMVMRRYGQEVSDSIDWSSPRLLCIAGGFTKYDEHAVQQINRNIELYQYKHYADGLLLFDLVNATTAQTVHINDEELHITRTTNKNANIRTFSYNLEQANTELTDRFETLKDYMVALGDDVQMKILKHYVAFKRIKNFACVEVHPGAGKVSLYLKVKPDSVTLEHGFTRDVTNIGHYGTGDLEVTISSNDDIEKAKRYINLAYDVS